MPPKSKKVREVWYPADYDARDIRAVQAVVQGEAGPEDQKRCLDWIIQQAAATYENGFVRDDPHGRIAAFMDGRQFVGQQIVKLMKLKPELFRKQGES